MKLVVEKLKETNLSVKNVSGDALAWFDNVFPPENWSDKLNHWVHVVTPFLIAVVALPLIICLLLCFFGLILSLLLCVFGFIFSVLRCILGFIFGFVRCCCVGIFRFFRFYFGRGGGPVGKMMKAPGRGGATMPRHVFKSNPKGYFSSLRARR